MSLFSIYLTSVYTWPFLIPVAACRALIGLALLVAGRCLRAVLHVVDIKWRLIALRGRTFIGRTQRSHIDGDCSLLPFCCWAARPPLASRIALIMLTTAARSDFVSRLARSRCSTKGVETGAPRSR